MAFKCQYAKHNIAKVTFIAIFKKKRLEASFFLNLKQLNINDNKLGIINTTNDNTNFVETWYWNKSTNKINSDFEEEDYNNVDKKDLEKEQSKIKQVVNPKNIKVILKQN